MIFLKKVFEKRFFAVFVCFLCLFGSGFFVSCGSTGNVAGSHSGEVPDFTKKQLSNGIPVIFKQNRGSKIVVLNMVFEGGSSVIDKNLGGIEGLAFDLALRGSENYPYSEIQRLEFEKSFSLTSASGKDYSTAGFVCIQRDLSEVLDLFSDCILNPSMLESDFKQKMTEIASTIARKKADPSGELGIAISKAAFENHPYATATSVTEDSYTNITLPLVNEIYSSLLNSQRIKIVAVGNFSNELISDFTSSLDKKFGAIPKNTFTLPKLPEISLKKDTVRIANEQAGDTGYIAGLFKCPSRDDSDYIPFAIATMYIDDLLFSQVREKAGAVYSINTGILGGKKMLGAISVYKASKKENLKKLICDSLASFDEAEIEKKLNQYKNKYISSIFSSSQTSAGVASSVISSMEYLGSETAYLKRADLVESVNAKQVIAAYKKYIEPVAKENAAQWIIVDGKKNLKKYDF